MGRAGNRHQGVRVEKNVRASFEIKMKHIQMYDGVNSLNTGH